MLRSASSRTTLRSMEGWHSKSTCTWGFEPWKPGRPEIDIDAPLLAPTPFSFQGSSEVHLSHGNFLAWMAILARMFSVWTAPLQGSLRGKHTVRRSTRHQALHVVWMWEESNHLQ
jgi:hypothetical protein